MERTLQVTITGTVTLDPPGKRGGKSTPDNWGVYEVYSEMQDKRVTAIELPPPAPVVISAQVLTAVQQSIRSALSPDPPADWKDSLSDAYDALT